MNIGDLEVNISDESSSIHINQIIDELSKLIPKLEKGAMSTVRQAFLDGKLEMLNEIIKYLKYTS